MSRGAIIIEIVGVGLLKLSVKAKRRELDVGVGAGGESDKNGTVGRCFRRGGCNRHRWCGRGKWGVWCRWCGSVCERVHARAVGKGFR